MPRQPDFGQTDFARFLTFIELDEFQDDWSRLGLDVERDLWDLQTQITAAPCAVVISGTGGLRKMRFAPANWSRGKRGSIRICYALYPQQHVVLLVSAYAKAEQENLTRQQRQGIKTYLGQIEAWLASRGQPPRQP